MLILTSLAGFPCMVPIARSVVRAVLPECPRREDAVQVVSEFVTASVLHSVSRGVQFELSLDIEPGWVRIAVTDGGPFGYPPPKPLAEPASPVHPWITLYQEDQLRDRAAEIEDYGHGLAIINAACDRWGTSRYPDRGVWWAELAWPEPAAVPLAEERAGIAAVSVAGGDRKHVARASIRREDQTAYMAS